MALVVVSIDLGTTYSGWAYAFHHQYERNPLDIHAKHWAASNFNSTKAPTSVLIRADGKTVEAFGYDAEKKYAELAIEGRHKDWFFFKQFKMKLFKSKEIIGKHTQLEDETGKKLEALTVFSLTIKYLYDDALTFINRQITNGIGKDDVDWVVTVPAIWDEHAKQFMIIAAKEAGIDVDRISIALEPEAASIYCRRAEMTRTDDSSGSKIAAFQPGTRYIVCDAGGGTVDIAVHEVTPDQKLKEIETASGGDWGGTQVDEAFVRFIDKLAGGAVMQAFKGRHMDDYLEFMGSFELKKREYNKCASDFIVLRFPSSFIGLVSVLTGKTLKEQIERSALNHQVRFILDKIKCDVSIISELFDAPVKNIIDHLKTILARYTDSPINHIIMVGGFSESLLLQEAVKNAFPEKLVTIPQDAGQVVMKGAVMFGHNRSQIESRIARYTYGIACWGKYDGSIHPANKVVMEGTHKGKVDDTFSKLVEIWQTIPTDKPAGSGAFFATGTNTTYTANVYATKATNPVFVYDDGCFKIGSFVVNCKDKHGKVSGTTLIIYFGRTHIDVKARLDTTGEEIPATFKLPD